MDDEAIANHLARLCDPALDRDEVYTAQLALCGAGRAAEAPLVAALGDDSRMPEMRSRIAGVLADLGSVAAIPVLTGLLGHASVHLRWSVAQALGRIGDLSAVEALTRALDDPGELTPQQGFTLTVRDAARSALDKLRGQPR